MTGRGLAWTAVATVLAAGAARAEPSNATATDYAYLARADERANRWSPEQRWRSEARRSSEPRPERSADALPRLDLQIALHLPARPTLEPADDLELGLPELPPERLCLSYDVDPALTVYVKADLDDPLPRLDAVDGDTYFTTGAALHVTSALSVFVEDFQAASGILGDGPVADGERVPEHSWDGHQVSLGLRAGADETWSLEGAAVFSVLSASGRPAGVGAIARLRGRF